jgi:hypothetical protein
MLNMLALAAAAAAPVPNAVPAVVGGLVGCWDVTGQVRGKDAPSIARGDWHIGRLYFMFQLRSVVAGKPYTAAIIYGQGTKPGTIGSYWLDVVGGTAPTPVTGAPTPDGFTVAYDFGDSVYTNHFARVSGGWRWTIVEQETGRPAREFAHYHLVRATCRNKKFDF